MKFWGLGRINKRILEIKHILADEKRIQDMAREATSRGIEKSEFERQLERAYRPLHQELDELETGRRFIHDDRTVAISIAAMLIALGAAFGVPFWQSNENQKADIQALYQAVVANEDIYIGNYNSLKYARNNNLPIPLPEAFIGNNLEPNMHKILQREIGIDLYRYFLAYVAHTDLLNEEIGQLRDILVVNGSATSNSTDVDTYWQSLESLQSGDWESSRFNYIHDTTCISSILTNSFHFLVVAERDKTKDCSFESLNRIFNHYGYIESEMPRWIRSQLRGALNEREPGLGDLLITL